MKVEPMYLTYFFITLDGALASKKASNPDGSSSDKSNVLHPLLPMITSWNGGWIYPKALIKITIDKKGAIATCICFPIFSFKSEAYNINIGQDVVTITMRT